MNRIKTDSKTRMLAKLRRAATTTIVAGAVAIVSACAQTRPAPAAGQDPLVISQATNAALQKYLGLIHSNQRGAFAVSADGANSYTFYCPDIACTPGLYGSLAVRKCESLSGQQCYLFYVSQDPRMAYSVSTAKGVPGRHGIKRAVPTTELPVFDHD